MLQRRRRATRFEQKAAPRKSLQDKGGGDELVLSESLRRILQEARSTLRLASAARRLGSEYSVPDFQDAGIAVEWIDSPLRDGQSGPQYQACAAPWRAADILLKIVPRSMEPARNPGHRLGYAMPLVGRPATRACVMAHETAHLPPGDEQHSRGGVKMAFWDERELAQIESGALGFTREEAGAMAPAAGL